MLMRGQDDNFGRELKTGLMIDPARNVAARFDRAVAASQFMPLIYIWADALVSRHRTANLVEDYFQWSQNLLSSIYSVCWSMQPLIGLERFQPWLPLNYCIWPPPEWLCLFRTWLPGEELYSIGEGEIGDQMPFPIAGNRPIAGLQLSVPNLQTGGKPFLVPGNDISLLAEVTSKSEGGKVGKEQRSDFAAGRLSLVGKLAKGKSPYYQGSTPPRKFIYGKGRARALALLGQARIQPWGVGPTAVAKESLEGVDGILPLHFGRGSGVFSFAQDGVQSATPVGLDFAKPYSVAPGTSIASLSSFALGLLPWLKMPRIFLPLTLGVSHHISETVRKEVPLGATSEKGEEGKQTGFNILRLAQDEDEKLLTQQHELASLARQGVFNAASWLTPGIRSEAVPRVSLQAFGSEITPRDVSPFLRLLSFSRMPELWPEDKENEASQSLRALPLPSPNLHHWLPQTEERRTSPLFQLGQLHSYAMLEKPPTPGILRSELNLGSQGSGREYAIAETKPSNRRSYYGESLSLPVLLETLTYSGAEDLRGVVVQSHEMGYRELVTQSTKQSQVDLPKPGRSADVALAPLDRPQGNSAPLVPGAEVTILPDKQRRQGATEIDPDVLAREVYKIIRHRLLVEREQAQGMA